MTKLGDLLRDYREYRGYSRRAVAHGAGLTTECVRLLENGRHQNPTVRTINSLAVSLNVPARRLFDAATSDVEAHDA